MDQNLLLVMVGLGGVILGLVLGVILGKRSAAGSQRSRQLEEELSAMRLDMDAYKQGVKQHFSETADAFKELNASYGKLHAKLATGAHSLCDDAAGLLPATSAIDLDTNPEEQDERQTELPLEPPRDYAPKKSPDEKGMLTEDFGLEKSAARPANDAA